MSYVDSKHYLASYLNRHTYNTIYGLPTVIDSSMQFSITKRLIYSTPDMCNNINNNNSVCFNDLSMTSLYNYEDNHEFSTPIYSNNSS